MARLRSLAFAGLAVVVGVGVAVTPAGAAARRDAAAVVGPGSGRITVTELQTLGGATSRPSDINDRGQVAGQSTTAAGDTHAALWDRGEVVDLTPGLTDRTGEAELVNRRGLVVGTLRLGLAADSFVWDGGDTTVIPSTPTNVPMAVNDRGDVLTLAYDYTDPARTAATVWRDGQVIVAPALADGAPPLGLDISDRGTVVGLAGFSANYLWTWRPGEAPVALPNPAGAVNAIPVAINGGDVVVGNAYVGTPEPGTRVVLWRDRVPTDIGTLGGASSFQADPTNTALSPINVWGDVVGASQTAAGESHAFLWRHGRMTDLGTLGGTLSLAIGINDVGQVVGVSSLAGEHEQHPFLWQRGHMLDLTTVPGLEHLVEVTDINNRGELVGVVDGPDTEPRGVVVRVPPWASLVR